MSGHRVDSNQAEIVAALRQVGASILFLHEIGKGAPDLLVGFRRENYLMETKTRDGFVNPLQFAWHRDWRGARVSVVRTVAEALATIGAEVYET